MRRLILLCLALSLALVASVAQAAPVVHHATAGTPRLVGDRDGDGYPDASDPCPDTFGPYNGCPTLPDRDGDGIYDMQDQCPDTPGTFNNQGCPPVADRDGDGVPDASDPCPDLSGPGAGCPPVRPSDRDNDTTPDDSDRCPDEAGVSGSLHGCPYSYDRDKDGLLDTDDKCPDAFSKLPDGCQKFIWTYFFSTGSAKDFAADKANDTTGCAGFVKCKATHVTFTLSAASAKAAHITNRRVGSIAVSFPAKLRGFDRGISSVNQKKLAKLKSITVTIHAWVILETGKRIDADEKTLTIRGFAFHQFNSDNNNGNVI